LCEGDAGCSDPCKNDDGGESGVCLVHWCNFLGEVDDVAVAGSAKVKDTALQARSVFGDLETGWLLTDGARGPHTIKRHGAGGVESPLVLHKAADHATFVREDLLAQPDRIRRAGIDILLGVGDCGKRGHNCQEQSYGAQFAHDAPSNLSIE
jgi:hypothetical protein